ncbi:MAG: RsmB/NOP family class I SAM-dependent RNA methyltransferase [Flavobacteriaceae bacterium]|nr:RsmB/NOP family class I SAM-dependent RNA methyltransferase [Flavobacteriaceae bacterium]
MRLHRNLVFAVIDTLHSIFNDDKYADKEISKTLKKDARWGSRDRGFIAETTYDIVRWRRLYEEIAEVKAPYSRPNLFRLFTVWATLKGIEIPDWNQFEDTPTRRIKGKFDELSKIRKFKNSIPDWLDELGQAELGEQWDAEIEALNTEAPVILRVNTLKTDKKTLQKRLERENEISTKFIEDYPDALQLLSRADVFKTESFKEGFFEVQDASSQKVAKATKVKPGMRAVDTCAGAGGKTLHLAAMMENKGQIIALDLYANKLRELKRRAKRAGAHNIETRTIDSTKVIKKLHDNADVVMIDAPCSGLGVLRRNPDAKWKLQPEFLDEIRKTQQEILQSYSKIVKKDGILVYATCSILPSENEKQIEKFLSSEEGKKFELQKEESILVSKTGHDGFYLARLKRTHS